MKTLLTIKDGVASAKDVSAPSEYFTAEVKNLGSRIRGMSEKMNHQGVIKMINQDQSGTLACQLDEKNSGRGIYINNAAVSHLNLLQSL